MFSFFLSIPLCLVHLASSRTRRPFPIRTLGEWGAPLKSYKDLLSEMASPFGPLSPSLCGPFVRSPIACKVPRCDVTTSKGIKYVSPAIFPQQDCFYVFMNISFNDFFPLQIILRPNYMPIVI